MEATATVFRRTAQRWRWVLVAHRWLGIVLGLLVLAWCASGIVMMYVPYPALSDDERRAGLEPVVLEDCCTIAGAGPLLVRGFSVEMFDSRPLLRATLASGERVIFDLLSGSEIERFDDASLRRVGLRYGDARRIETVILDQWTVQARFNRHRPMLRFADDPGVEWYLSSATGELVQHTTRWERGWNWVGSVVHWLYPTVLRQHTAAWAQVVIWLTIVALLLVVTGAAFGIRQYRREHRYRGARAWHHYAGLLFGVFTLLWLVSGLVSMNPWGLLEGRSFAAEVERLEGEPITLAAAVREIERANPSATTVEFRYAPARGILQAYGRNGLETRSPIAVDESRRLVEGMRPGRMLASFERLDRPDAYYYRGGFPVHRAIFDDGERIYLDPDTGALKLAVDDERASYRWLFSALHRGDFHAVARLRPFWDVWMVSLMVGLLVGAGTGVYLGARHVAGRARRRRT